MIDALWFMLLALACGWSALHLTHKRAVSNLGANVMLFLFMLFGCGFLLFLGIGFGAAYDALQSGAL